MDDRADFDDRPDAPRNATTESAPGAADGETEGSSGALARVKTVGTEAIGAVADAVLDAL